MTTPVRPSGRTRIAALAALAATATLAAAALALARGRAPAAPEPPARITRASAPRTAALLADVGGRDPVAILYVTETCPYCRAELDAWAAAAGSGLRAHPRVRVHVIAPAPLPAGHVPAALRATVVHDSGAALARELGVSAVPSVFLLSADGEVRMARVGVRSPAEISAALRTALSPEIPEPGTRP